MNIVIWVAVGIVIGWMVATFVKHSSRNLIDIIFGLTGAIVGAFIGNNAAGLPSTSVYTFIFAAIGAIIFIFLGRLRSIAR